MQTTPFSTQKLLATMRCRVALYSSGSQRPVPWNQLGNTPRPIMSALWRDPERF